MNHQFRKQGWAKSLSVILTVVILLSVLLPYVNTAAAENEVETQKSETQESQTQESQNQVTEETDTTGSQGTETQSDTSSLSPESESQTVESDGTYDTSEDNGADSADQNDEEADGETSMSEDAIAPADEDSDSSDSVPEIGTFSINTTDSNIISADVTFWTGTTSYTDHSVNELLFNVELNAIGASIPYYSLVPSFSGAVIDSVTVYSYDSNGELVEVDASLYSYDSSTGMVTFNNLSERCLVQYTTSLTSSFKDADMAAATGPDVDASFTANYGDSDTDYQTASDSIKVKPIDASNYNNDTIATNVTIAEDAKTSTGSSVTATILWRLYSLLEDDGVTESDITDYSAGSYFVFKLDTDLMEFYNNTSGNLTRIETNEQVGSYYTTDDGYVIILLDANAEITDFVDGSIALTSHIDGYDSEKFEYDVLITNDMVYDEPQEASFSISKSGLITGETGIEWSIIVNAEGSTLTDLTITDSDSKNNGKVSSDYQWVISGDGTNLSTGALKVYEYDPNTGTRGAEVSMGTADGEYSVLYTSGDSSDNGSVEIVIHGETNKTYEIVLQGIDDEESTTSGEKRTYQNTVTATADDEPEVSAEASVTKTFTSISKSLQSITTVGSTGTATWGITYNTNGTSVATSNVVLTDKLGPAEYLTSTGTGSGDYLEISDAVKNLTITYTPVGGSLITLDPSDYTITIVDDDPLNPKETYTITITLTESGYNNLGTTINGSLSISYQTEVDLISQTMPTNSAGWKIANVVSTDKISSGTATGTFTGLVKSYVSVDYNNETVSWKSTVNATLNDGDTLYDVMDDGLLIIQDSIEIMDANNNTVPVYTSSSLPLPAPPEYFLVDFDQKLVSASPTYIEYTAGRGFKLTYVNDTGISSGGFVITYKTSFNFDSSQFLTAGGTSDDGYIDQADRNINRMYLVTPDFYITDYATVTLGGTAYNNNGLKNAAYTTLLDEGTINSGRITWTSYINAQNKDISGWTFTDPLLLGKESSSGSEVSNSEQTIENVYIYAYTVNSAGSWSIIYTDLTSEIKNYNGSVSIVNNEVQVTFPSGTDMDDFMAANNLTSMRFAIQIVTTLDNEIAPYYPNTSYLTDLSGNEYKWSASITPTQYRQQATKVGTISNGIIDYSVTLNKGLYLVEDMVITDSLMYDNDGNQLLYLKYDEGDTKYGIKIYKAKVSIVNSALKYEADYTQEVTDFTVDYSPGESSNQGFKITMGSDVNYALVVEYSCYVNQDLVTSNQTLENTVNVTGSASEEADWSEAYKYNTSSGSYSGIQVDVSLQKVDEDENPLAGATFVLYDATRSYVAREGTVDENGLLTLNEILTGVYYLVETPPEGYGTDYSGLSNAIRLAITYDAATGEVTMTLGPETNPITTVTGSMDDTPAAVLNIPNEKITGSFSVTKYANDENGETTDYPLVGAKFVLYRETADENGTVIKNYYSGTDENGILIFETQDISEALTLKTDENGVLEQDNLVSGTYYLKEVEAPAGYDVIEEPITLNIPSQGEYKIGNIYDNRTLIDITVEKIWVGNSENELPEPITIHLYRSTETEGLDETFDETAIITAEDNWEYTFTDLPETDKDGNPYTYEVKEESHISYDTEVEGYKITNIRKTIDISGSKTWSDEGNETQRPDSITINLYRNGGDKPIASQIIKESDNWTYTFENLPKYDTEGEEYVYTVTENKVPGYTTEVDGYNITNTLVTLDVSGTKTWVDEGNKTQRPDSITVNLYRNGSDQPIASQIVKESDNWTYTFENLPKYDTEGEEYVYTVTENEVPGYTTKVDGYDITNTLVTLDVSGTKTWVDEGNETERPENITINLYRNGGDVPYATQPVKEETDGSWTYTFDNLPKYDREGKEYVYTVTENEVPGYTTEVDSFDITNTLITIDISGTKTWVDTGNESQRPDSITVNLYRNDVGEPVQTQIVTLSEDDTWSFSFTNLPKYDRNGNEYIYSIAEEDVAGYTAAINGFDIINTLITLDIGGVKTWADDGNETQRPDSITIELYRNGVLTSDQIVKPDAAGSWAYSFEDLPMYDKSGTAYRYSVIEKEVPGYTTEYEITDEGYDIHNTLITRDVDGAKKWVDEGNESQRPENITVELYRNDGDESLATQKVTADTDGNWTYTFENLPKYDKEGVEYVYTVTENEVAGYTTEINGYNITNTLVTIDVNGTKTWVDEGNESQRPESITIDLYRNGGDEAIATQTVTANAEGNWTYAFENLPKYDKDGAEYVYTVTENEVPGYTTEIDGYDITNTLVTIDVSGTKTWDDTGYESKRPDSITINLYRNGGDEPIATKTVTENSNGKWTYTYDNLPRYDKNGDEYVYTITEDKVAGYTATIKGYNIVNKYNTTKSTTTNKSTTGSKSSSTTTKSVSTGDESNGGFYMLLVLFSTGVIIAAIFAQRRKKRS